ncbi:MAG: sugar transferase [Fibrobacterales bacterium]
MKRLFDIVCVIGIGITLWPLLIILYVVNRHYHGSPVLFKQQRPGKSGTPFFMYKFRSMTNECDVQGTLLPDSQRLTPFGIRLRNSSLDELPELLNVLKGEMSLVGPRPLLMEYLPLYSETQAQRHNVRPGVTGWAQINGRNSLSWEEKFDLDVWYVENRTLWLDTKILFLTIKKVFVKEGISAEGEATMSKFTGTSSGGQV